MTVIRKPIGRLPLNLGDYVSTKVYGKKNRVFMYGCEWESKVENNTYAPAALDTQAGTITPDATHWKLVSGSYEMWLVDHGYKTMDYVPTSQKGQAGGVATLDNGGKVPAEQLPSYVDDVVDLLDITGTAPAECAEGDLYYNSTSKKIFTATGVNTWGATGADPEKGKIYMNLANGNSYRWSGNVMSPVGNPDVYNKSEVDGLVAAERQRAQDVEATKANASELAGKQDIINDINDIRNGAAAGATAQQPATTLAGYGITDGYTKAEGQALEDSVAATLAEQDSKIDLLNGSEVVVVADHTAVSNPDSQTIYRQYGTTSYTDWMCQNGAWQDIATYSMPGIDAKPTEGSNNLITSGAVSAALDGVKIEYIALTWPTTGKTFSALGAEVANADMNISDFIAVDEGSIYEMYICASNNAVEGSSYAFPVFGYASQDAASPIDIFPMFMSRLSVESIQFAIPRGVSYIRLTNRITLTNAYLLKISRYNNSAKRADININGDDFLPMSKEVVCGFVGGYVGTFSNVVKFRPTYYSGSEYKLYFVPCSPGDIFNIEASSTYMSYMFLNSSLSTLSAGNNGAFNGSVIAPEGTAYFASVLTDTAGKVTKGVKMFEGISGVRAISQAAYNALTLKVPTILYVITD